MIPVDKDFAQPPLHLQSEAIKQKLQAILDNRDAGDVKSGYNHSEVLESLRVIYQNKCGFCESKLGISSSAQIDHYRPKTN